VIITIAGKPGSGKSCVAEELAKKLKYPLFSAGDLFRNIAKEKKVSVIELNQLAEKDSWLDTEVDRRIIELGRKKNVIIGGHISAFLIKNAKLKIYLTANPFVRAKRIAKRENISFLRAFFGTMEREILELHRWKRRYNFDYRDKKAYNLVIDTTHMTSEGVVKIILARVRAVEKKK
jgi:predicted cytidylate kinase